MVLRFVTSTMFDALIYNVAQVTLTKKSGGEEVMITLNVNHTVDSAAPDDGTGEVRQSLTS